LANEDTVPYLSRARLIKLLGFDAASRLVAKFGGRRFSVPPPDDAARFEMVAGEIGDRAAADRFCTEYGGLRVTLPLHLVRVKARIRELAGTGLSPLQIASELRCSERYVYAVLAEKLRPSPAPRAPARK
jgi:hypothetical protein